MSDAGLDESRSTWSVSATLSDSKRGVAERLGTEVATRDDRGGMDVAVEAAPEGHPPGTVPRWGRAGLRIGVLAECRDDTDLGSTPLRTLTVDRGCRGRGEDQAEPGHRVGVWSGGWA